MQVEKNPKNALSTSENNNVDVPVAKARLELARRLICNIQQKWCWFSRVIGCVTPKINHFCCKTFFLGYQYPKNVSFDFENKITGQQMTHVHPYI